MIAFFLKAQCAVVHKRLPNTELNTLSDGFCPAIKSPSSLFPRKNWTESVLGLQKFSLLCFSKSKAKM